MRKYVVDFLVASYQAYVALYHNRTPVCFVRFLLKDDTFFF